MSPAPITMIKSPSQASLITWIRHSLKVALKSAFGDVIAVAKSLPDKVLVSRPGGEKISVMVTRSAFAKAVVKSVNSALVRLRRCGWNITHSLLLAMGFAAANEARISVG